MNSFTPKNLEQKLISSVVFNNEMENLRNDVFNIYQHYKRGLSKIDYIDDMNKNFVNHIRNQIDVLERELGKFENNIKSLNENTDILKDSFKNNDMIEDNIEDFYEALNFLNTGPYPMLYKNKLQSLESYVLDSIDIDYDVSIVDKTYKESIRYGHENNLRENTFQNYWYEEVTFKETMNNTIEVGDNGLTVTLELRIKEIVNINQISIFAFSKYPLSIEKIYYRDNNTKDYKVIKENSSFIENETFNILFDTVQSDMIYIKLKQIHFEKTDNKYKYDIGLYSINLKYNAYPSRTHFLSKKIYLKEKTEVDYYKLSCDDSSNIEYKVIEYNKITESITKTFHRDIININNPKIKGEELLFRLIKDKYIASTRYPFEYEHESQIVIYKDGARLKNKLEYFIFSNQEIQVFNYDEQSEYTIEYLIEDGVSTEVKSGSTIPDYIRILGIANNDINHTEIKSYSLKIKYKGGEADD